MSSAKEKARPEPGSASIEVRHCKTLAEFDECLCIQQQIWSEKIAVPTSILAVARHTGGQILGAFDRRKMIGFTLALRGHRGNQRFLHSHMTAVLPRYENKGVGRKLKLFQRQDALKHAVDLVEWTFDPLELKNAHFNFVRLGAISRRFIVNCYGVTDSKLDAGLPTDRLVAEWWLDSERVKNVLSGTVAPRPQDARAIALPSNLAEIKTTNRQAAAEIQSRVREQFQKCFAEGYVATGIETRGDITEYLLQPAASMEGLRLPEYRPDEFGH